MRETFTCPACNDYEVEVTLEFTPEEKRTRDYPGSPAEVEAFASDYCLGGCELTLSAQESVERSARCWAYAEYNIPRPVSSRAAA